MKKCPFCAEEIEDEAIKCSHCCEFLDGRVEMKRCPFCAEVIRDEAIKCSHCCEFLDGTVGTPPPLASTLAVPGLPFYFKTSFIIVGACCVGPLVLPLIWWHPRISPVWKVIWTVAIAALTWWAFVLTKDSIKTLQELYQQMGPL